MKVIILLIFLFFSNSLFSQVWTKVLYQRSVNLLLKECKCDVLNFLPDEVLGTDSLLPQKSQIKVTDSIFFSDLKQVDTSFKIMKILPLELIGKYIDVIINQYTFFQRDGNTLLIFNSSRHYYFSFDRRYKKYLFIKTFLVSL
jgi:hypothetical protein